MKPVILFDVNGTLLDMSALDPVFARIFEVPDGSWVRQTWFGQLLQLCFTATITSDYRSFDKLADDALQMVALRRGGKASTSDRATLEAALPTVPPFPDVRSGLAALHADGFTLAALTNSTEKSVKATLAHAGLDDAFSAILSVEAVECYKPARQTYEYAARELGVEPKHICLVAAHAWDITGAMAAGCKAAFLHREDEALNPNAPQPEIDARNMSALAVAVRGRFT